MQKNLAQTIWIFTILIIGFGLVTLYSASYENVRVSHQVFYDQFWGAVAGLILMFILSRIDYRKFYDVAYVVYILNVLLLLLVMFAGRHALGARRWFELGGISFQPSELTKLAIILTLGRYFSAHRSPYTFRFVDSTQVIVRDLIIPLILTAIPTLLIFKQPDLGSAILVFSIFLIILFASGVRYRIIAAFLAVVTFLVPFGWHILKPYQRDRLLVFLNPNIDPLGAGYTIIQSKIAIGSGQIFGKGWLAGTQNQLNFLPERHTDFIFSVVGEEWGLMGTLFMVGCYLMIINAGFTIARQIKDPFGVLVSVGIVGIFALQVSINIAMVSGLCPVVGITLPLVSYGRTSFFVFIVMMGFLLNLSRRRVVF